MDERNMLDDLLRVSNAFNDGIARLASSPEFKQFADALGQFSIAVSEKLQDPETRAIIENALRNFAKAANNEDDAAALNKMADDVAAINRTGTL